jgi:hypothetical protein
VSDPHRNCFYHYRGPSARPEEWAQHHQVEDYMTKAARRRILRSVSTEVGSDHIAQNLGLSFGEPGFAHGGGE